MERRPSWRRQLGLGGGDVLFMREIADGLARAFDRIADFRAVQSGASEDTMVEAAIRLQESVGIDDDARRLIGERLAAIPGSSGTTGAVVLGLIVGLTSAQLTAEGHSGEAE